MCHPMSVILHFEKVSSACKRSKKGFVLKSHPPGHTPTQPALFSTRDLRYPIPESMF